MFGTVVIKNDIRQAISLLKNYKNEIDRYGNIFLIIRNEYLSNGDVDVDLFDVIDAAISDGFLYINTIVVPSSEKISIELPDNVIYILWLAIDKCHYFNKDAIRESHIWKDVEWGHRAKNYNPLGKDPGNVWIPTIDDGKAHIISHVLLSTEDIVNRIFKASKQPSLQFILDSDSIDDKDILANEITFVHHASSITRTLFQSVISPPSLPQQRAVSGKVIWGSSESMDPVQDGSIDVVITSPPYWDLKDYFKKGQIGQEPYQTYLNRLQCVWKECYKKLTPTGSFWLNINIRVKDNHVVLIPRDFIKQCRAIGFHYKGILIWHKSSGIPTHARNIVDRFEYVLIFTKSEHIKINSLLLTYGDYKNVLINGGLFWNINRKAGSVGKKFIHPAIYPNQLVERIVDVATDRNQTVLDPFLGSGTTLVASLSKGRNCIGFEYNEGFKELIQSRIDSEILDQCDTSVDLDKVS